MMKGRRRRAARFSQAYAVKDRYCGTVDFSGVIRMYREGSLSGEGLEIRISDRKGNPLALIAIPSSPVADLLA